MTVTPDETPDRGTLADSMSASERATIAARYGLALAVVFFLGVMNRWLMDGRVITQADVLGGLYATLILVNPLASLVTGVLIGYKHGRIWLFPPLVGVAFIPATYAVYNPSALPYALAYVVFGGAGMLIGHAVDRRSRRRFES